MFVSFSKGLMNFCNVLVQKNLGFLESARLFWVVICLLTGCATYQVSNLSPDVADEWLAENLSDKTSLAANSFVRFKWQLREPDLRVEGQGVVRLGVPDKARVDLFLENGESVLAAALVGDDIRIGQEQGYLGVIPSPPLLWASLGLFRPGDNVALVTSQNIGTDRVRLVYSLSSGSRISYDMSNGVIEKVSLIENGQIIHVVDLETKSKERLPLKATYRNLISYRELVIELETTVGVESYEENIWHPSD